MVARTNPTRYVVDINPDIVDQLVSAGVVVRIRDGRVYGMDGVIQKSLEERIRRLMK